MAKPVIFLSTYFFLVLGKLYLTLTQLTLTAIRTRAKQYLKLYEHEKSLADCTRAINIINQRLEGKESNLHIRWDPISFEPHNEPLQFSTAVRLIKP